MYLCQNISALSKFELKEVVFTGANIMKLISNVEVNGQTNEPERETWITKK